MAGERAVVRRGVAARVAGKVRRGRRGVASSAAAAVSRQRVLRAADGDGGDVVKVQELVEHDVLAAGGGAFPYRPSAGCLCGVDLPGRAVLHGEREGGGEEAVLFCSILLRHEPRCPVLPDYGLVGGVLKREGERQDADRVERGIHVVQVEANPRFSAPEAYAPPPTPHVEHDGRRSSSRKVPAPLPAFFRSCPAYSRLATASQSALRSKVSFSW